MFLFPFYPQVERHGRTDRIRRKHPSPCTGRGQSFVLLAPLSHLLSTLSTSKFWTVQVNLSRLVLPCPVLPLVLLPTRRHHTYARRGSTAQLPAQLPNLCASHLGRRANAPPSPVDFHKNRATTHSLQRPVVPFHDQPAAEYPSPGRLGSNPHVAVGLQFVGGRESRLCWSRAESLPTQH